MKILINYLFLIVMFIFQKGFAMEITSSKFNHNENIPKVYTCEGSNISPPLSWSAVPDNTRSLVLIVDDPDAPDPRAPKMTWVHWILYNLPVDVDELAENLSANKLPEGTKEGLNDWKSTGYRGPCPPIGKHRYYFKLYALDVVLDDLQHPSKDKLINAMSEHVITETQFIGTYQKTTL